MIPGFVNTEYVARQIFRMERTDGGQSDNHFHNIATHAALTQADSPQAMSDKEKQKTRAFISEFKLTV